ncbi:MAG TPA: hypothetical protein VKB43_02120 [Gaiellaceae bacterium]|nr:hypothetical protein [Gaiellaceae bacterium]
MSRKGLTGIILALAAMGVGAVADAGTTTRSTGWCAARSSTSWQQVLARHIVPLSRTTPLHAMAIANDGRSFFTQIYTKRFTGVAEVNAKTGHVTTIKAFPDPTPALGNENADQALGAFDGRWLVWNEYRGETSFNRFTTWAWDSHTRRLTRIGASAKGPSGKFWQSPWHGPDVRQGFATWVQGSGADQLTDVHVYDLRTGRGRVIHTGHAQASFLLADHLVAWPESPKRGAETKMDVASALTGKRVQAPTALRALRGISGLDTDGRRIAYPSAHFKSLWWSPSLQRKPLEILRASRLHYVDNGVQIGSRYLGFGIQPRLFVGDTKTRRYVQVSDGYGWTLINTTTLLVSYGNGNEKSDPILKIALVPLRDLPPMPACGKSS